MKAGHKFLLGAGIIVASVAILMAQGVKQFGQYSLKPSELAQRVSRDPSLYETGLKMEAKVVPGSVKRDAAYLHRRPGHRSGGRGPAGEGRGVPGHHAARQVRITL